MMSGMMTGLLGMAMWLMMGVMLLGVAAGGVAWVRRRLRGSAGGPEHGSAETAETAETPEELLRRRYAAGEIDREEYLRRRDDLRTP